MRVECVVDRTRRTSREGIERHVVTIASPASSALPWFSGEEIFQRVGYASVIRAIQRELRAGLDPSADSPRSVVQTSRGQFLLMPAEVGGAAGVKVATVAPGNPVLGKERIQALYILFDAETLSPQALLDGTALTTLRTPAMSMAAADLLLPTSGVDHLVVFGYGPQARGHVEALQSIREVGRVSVVGRNLARVEAAIAGWDLHGPELSVAGPEAVREAQVVVCATTAQEPLFDGGDVPDACCVIAVGSHEPDVRELDGRILSRSQVVVEDVETALRESGDVIMAVAEGALQESDLVPVSRLVTGGLEVDLSRPRVFKSSGMSWEDLVVANEVLKGPSDSAD